VAAAEVSVAIAIAVRAAASAKARPSARGPRVMATGLRVTATVHLAPRAKRETPLPPHLRRAPTAIRIRRA